MDERQTAAALAQLLDAQDVQSTMGGWAARMRRRAGRPEAPTRVPMPDRTAGEALWDLTTFVAPVDLELPEHMASALENWGQGNMGAAAGAAGMAGLGLASSLPVVGAAPKAVKRGIRAYHGSPHDFDKFDLSKIGTGEGVQAYGHGLYAADAEDVARGYRDKLGGSDFTRTQSGAPISEDLGRTLREAYDTAGRTATGSSVRAAWLLAESKLNGEMKSALRDNNMERYKQIGDQISELYRIKRDPPRTSGHMYEVQINADPEHFLDWDKPLSEQSEHVQGALSRYPSTAPELRDGMQLAGGGVLRVEADPDFGPRYFVEIGGSRFRLSEPEIRNLTGAGGDAPSVYQHLSASLGGDQAASEALREAGVPGIRYLDQGSRAAGEGTRNYVLFSDDIIEILRKYGIAGLAMLPPATAAVVRQQLGLPEEEGGGTDNGA